LGYPTALAILAEKQREGRLRIAPQQLRTSGEPLRDADRERIERAFGAPLFNTYVCTEHLVMGLSRAEYGGMYLFEDDLIFELAADHTLVTNLFNHTLPLIRYRMNDVLVAQEDDRGLLPFTKLEIVGRNEHTPIFTNEHGEDDFVSAPVIIAFSVKNVRRFQLELIGRTACVLRVCLSEGLDVRQRNQTLQDAHARFGALLAQKEMRNVRYEVEAVDDLPPDPKTGKFRLIVPANDDRGSSAMGDQP
jgi:phenylacetate-coenzyme A ligase PaaK-like adenylate-forming protein